MTKQLKDAAFGPDPEGPQDVTYKTLVAQIEAMEPRALSQQSWPDAVKIIEWMRNEALRAHKANEILARTLTEREVEVARRERAVDAQQKVVATALGMAPRNKRSTWWGK
jgi:hypothetical protein